MSANANNTPQVTGFLLNITKHLSDKKGSLSTGLYSLIFVHFVKISGLVL